MNEQWRAVVGWESVYEVSDRGRVRSLTRTVVHCNRETSRKGQLLRWYRGSAFLNSVSLSTVETGRVWRRVHVLVLEAFTGLRPYGKVVKFLDGNRENCAATNLAWGDRTRNPGWGPKITAEQKKEIKEAYKGQYGEITKLAKTYRVSVLQITKILLNRSWKEMVV